jgi:hypothetical protein
MFRPFSLGHHQVDRISYSKQLYNLHFVALVFIIPWKALYVFRVLFAPIIRSVLKLYMQLLVQSCVGIVSDPAG